MDHGVAYGFDGQSYGFADPRPYTRQVGDSDVFTSCTREELEQDQRARHLVKIADDRKILRTALERAKQKLQLYQQAHGGEYVGGVEYSALIREIDDALKL